MGTENHLTGGQCGTPLTFACNGSKWICVTVGSPDNPSRLNPQKHYGIESQVHWLQINDELPRELDERLSRMSVFQFSGRG